MASRISHTTFDAHDAHAQSVFWSAVLDWSGDPRDPNEPGHEECMIFSPDGTERLLFIEVPESKTVKNRLHLDLAAADDTTRDAEVDRILGLGATVLADLRTPDGGGWVTCLDPEGNEFCILRGRADRPDPYAHLVTG